MKNRLKKILIISRKKNSKMLLGFLLMRNNQKIKFKLILKMIIIVKLKKKVKKIANFPKFKALKVFCFNLYHQNHPKNSFNKKRYHFVTNRK